MSRDNNTFTFKNNEGEISENLLAYTNFIYIRKLFQRFGHEPVYDENENVVLKVGRFPQTPNSNYKIIINGVPRYILCEKELSIRRTHFLTSSEGKIAKMGKRLFSSDYCFYFKNSEGDQIFETNKNNFDKKNYKIYNSSTSEPLCRVKLIKSSLGLENHLKEYLQVKFFDDTRFKIMLVCFILYIRKITLRYDGLSDITGFGRNLARLRPFGPK